MSKYYKDNLIVADRMRTIIAASNMTQQDVAKSLGISAAALSGKLNGKVRFTANDVAQVADLFHISADVLLGRAPLVVGQ